MDGEEQPGARSYLRANRTFFLVILLLVVTVGGYFWWRSGFTFEIGKFFAFGQCPTAGDLVCRSGDVYLTEENPDTGSCMFTLDQDCGSGTCSTVGGAHCETAAPTPTPTATSTKTPTPAATPTPSPGAPTIVIVSSQPLRHGDNLRVQWSKTDAQSCTSLNGWVDTGGANQGDFTNPNPINACGATTQADVRIQCRYANGTNTPVGAKDVNIDTSSCPTAPTPTPTPGGGDRPGTVCDGVADVYGANGVVVCTRSRGGFSSDRCTQSAAGKTLRMELGIYNGSSENIYSKPAIFFSNTPTCGAHAANPGNASGLVSGVKNLAPGQEGIVVYTFTAGECGSWQLDDTWGPDNFVFVIGKVIDTGVACTTPTPTTPPPTTTVIPTTVPPTTTVVPVSLQCAPGTQTVNTGQSASFSATGGTGAYSWFAPGGSPGTGSGASFAAAYQIPGFKTVTVVSGGNQASCTVTVTEQVEETHTECNAQNACVAVSGPGTDECDSDADCTVSEPVCAPSSQTVDINERAEFTVSGGDSPYDWSAPGGSPSSGAGTGFSTRYSSAGTRTVTVTDDAGESDTCSVRIRGPEEPDEPDLDIDKRVRNVTQNSGESDNATAAPGDTVEFIIRISNDGDATARNVTVRDTLPSGLTYRSGSTTVDGDAAADGIVGSGISLGDMAAGRSITVRFRATVAGESFFSIGTTVLTNIAYADASNTPEVSDTAVVTVSRGGQLSMTLAKRGRNISRGQTGEFSPVYSDPAQTIEFVLRVRNTSSNTLTNVTIRDVLPERITFIPGSVRVNGQAASDTLVTSGIGIGSLAVGQEAVVLFSGRVAAATAFPSGTTTLTNTAYAVADNVPQLTAQLAVIIGQTPIGEPSAGPGESTMLALIISAIITLLYVGYTSTDAYRRREAEGLSGNQDKDLFDFKR